MRLTSGLANWMRLLRWLTGDDSQLAVTSRWQHRPDREWDRAVDRAVKKRVDRSRIIRSSSEDQEFHKVIAGVVAVLDPDSDDGLAQRLLTLADLCDTERAVDLGAHAPPLLGYVLNAPPGLESLVDMVTIRLRDRQFLLIFDNAEHVDVDRVIGRLLDAAAYVAQLPREAETVSTLIWSGLVWFW